jgi:hypothetical protein
MSVALLVCVPATSAVAAPPSGPVVPLIHNPLNNCEFGADAIPGSGTPTRSFVVVHQGQRDALTAQVLLLNGLSNVTYHAYLIQSDGDTEGDPLDCHVEDGTLRTDAHGRGTVRLTDVRLPSARYVHVYLYTSDSTFDIFDTRLVPVG